MSSSVSVAGEALHDGVGALAGLELLQLLDEVFRVLALQDRVGRAAARAVGGVAGRADLVDFSWPLARSALAAAGAGVAARAIVQTRGRAPISRFRAFMGRWLECGLRGAVAQQTREFYNAA
jgi:hypothetical protein